MSDDASRVQLVVSNLDPQIRVLSSTAAHWRMACTRLFAYGSRSRTAANARPAVRHLLFQAIYTFIVETFGMFIGTVSGRLLWPVLPQRVLRDNLLAVLAQIKALLDGDAHREKIQTQLAILPVEALQAARQIRIAGCSQKERAKLVGVIRALQTLIARITRLVSRRNILPETTATILRPQFERLEVEFKQTLDAFAECFRQGDCRQQFQTSGTLAGMNDLVETLRERRMFAGQSVEAPLQMLNLLDHYHATAGALDECRRLLRNLQIERTGETTVCDCAVGWIFAAEGVDKGGPL